MIRNLSAVITAFALGLVVAPAGAQTNAAPSKASAEQKQSRYQIGVRGFHLEGYGLFFDIIVPSFEGTMPWALRTLDQNDLGLGSALKALKAHVDAAGDTNLEQALRRIEHAMRTQTLNTPRTAPRKSAAA